MHQIESFNPTWFKLIQCDLILLIRFSLILLLSDSVSVQLNLILLAFCLARFCSVLSVSVVVTVVCLDLWPLTPNSPSVSPHSVCVHSHLECVTLKAWESLHPHHGMCVFLLPPTVQEDRLLAEIWRKCSPERRSESL